MTDRQLATLTDTTRAVAPRFLSNRLAGASLASAILLLLAGWMMLRASPQPPASP